MTTNPWQTRAAFIADLDAAIGGGGGGGASWGSITGTLSAQTDLNTALGLKAPLASPTFTGTVTLPAGQSVNGVTLSSSGSSSLFLSEAGTYSAPTINSYFPSGW